MMLNIYNKIVIVYIVKLIRKLNYLNGYSYKPNDIYHIMKKLNIKPLPPKNHIKKILELSGKVEDKIC